jgi:hypothetical protein
MDSSIETAAPEQPRSKWMRRREAVEWLFEDYGIRMSEKTLRNQHVQGKGPPCVYFGSWWVTKKEWMAEWVESRLSPRPANRRDDTSPPPTVAEQAADDIIEDRPARRRRQAQREATAII